MAESNVSESAPYDLREPADAPRPKVVVVGSVNMDLVVAVPRHPVPGETIIGSDYVTHPGGKGANQAVAAARLGAEVCFVGRVGNDGFGGELGASFAADGVDVTHLRTSNGSSGVAFIQVGERGQNSIVVSPGANYAVKSADVPASVLEGAAALLLQLEIPLDVVQSVARRARQRGLAVVLNLAPAERLDRSQLKDVTHLVVNEHEAGLLLGVPSFSVTADAEDAAKRLLELAPHVVVTLGDKGATWAVLDAEGTATAGSEPAFEVKAVDSTAAGDAFTGAFAVALARELREDAGVDDAEAGGVPAAARRMMEAVRFACAAGALATTRPGAQPSLPRLADVERFLDGVKL